MSEHRGQLVDNVAQACVVVTALEEQLRDDGLSWREIPREVGKVLAEDYSRDARGVSMGNVRLAVRRLNA